MPPAAIPAALLLLGALLPLVGDRAPKLPVRPPGAVVPTAAALAASTRAAGAEGRLQAVYQTARALGVELRGTMPATQRQRLRARLRALLDGLSRSPGAPLLPWSVWLLDDRRPLPEFAAELLLAAQRSLGPGAASLAAAVDLADSPVELRLEALGILWDFDPVEGDTRTRKLVARDLSWRQTERDQRLADGIIRQVLGPRRDPTSTVLLADLAARSSLFEHARRLAIRALVARRAVLAAPSLDAIFATEANNVLLRKEALIGLLALRPERALKLLAQTHSDSRVEPVLFAFLNDLRLDHGLPILAPTR